MEARIACAFVYGAACRAEHAPADVYLLVVRVAGLTPTLRTPGSDARSSSQTIRPASYGTRLERDGRQHVGPVAR